MEKLEELLFIIQNLINNYEHEGMELTEIVELMKETNLEELNLPTDDFAEKVHHLRTGVA